MTIKSACVIIPAYNSESTIKKAINGIRSTCPDIEIVVVNDGSDDATQDIVVSLGANLISNNTNLGFGASLKNGIKYALDKQIEFFVITGADNQRDPQDINRLLEEITIGNYDIVTGSKLLAPNQKIPFMRRCGDIALTFVLNKLFGSNYSDVMSGFRVFNKKVAQDIFNLSNFYSFDADLCIRAVKKGYKYKEIPAKVFYGKNTSKMRNVFAVGLNILCVILKRRFKA